MKVAILTSPNQWFIPFAEELKNNILDSKLFFDHKKIKESFDNVFILSYHKLIEKSFLIKNRHNLVIHESDLPKGKGWAPMFWQILEGKDKITFTMFEATEYVDNGDVYMKKDLILTGYELNNELREKQAELITVMSIDFIKNYEKYNTAKKQVGNETFYLKRTKLDSELDINKTIDNQFNLLRIVSNEDYPAYFYKNEKKYKIKIEEVKNENW